MSDLNNDKMNNDDNFINIISSNHRILFPLEMKWQPKEDITSYELALCMQYLFRLSGVMPNEIDMNEPHFRHFEIINHNK